MQVLFPRTLQELWAMFIEFPEAKTLAGGTDFLVKMRKTGVKPPAVFCLENLTELKRIETVGQEVVIGAAVTVQELLDCQAVEQKLSVLHQALSVLGSPPIRHSATLGGNICTASPAGDSLPPLYVLGANIEIAGNQGKRRVALQDFILGPGRTALRSGEIVTNIVIPLPPEGFVSVYEKVGKRKALAIAVASLASLVLQDESGIIRQIKLAWGSVGPTIVTLPEVEKLLTGKQFSQELLIQAESIVAANIIPIDDVRASAVYRRQLAGNLLLRLSNVLK